MNKTSLLPIALLLLVGMVTMPALAEMHMVSHEKDGIGIERVHIDYNCQYLGHGTLTYSLYDDYVHVIFTKELNSSTVGKSERQFSYDEYKYEISPYYVNLLSVPENEC